MRRLPGILVLLATAVCIAPAAASEPHPTAQLHYENGSGAESCPSAAPMRAAVVQRLGYDPFDTHSVQRVDATIRRARGAFVATASIRSGDGVPREREPLTSAASDCSEIASSLALAISIAIDPMSLVRAPAPAPPLAGAAMPSSAPAPDPAPRPAPPPSPPPLGWRVSAGLGASAGALPSLSGGPILSGGILASSFGLNLEGRYDFPVTKDGPNGGTVSGSLLLGTLAPCWHPKPLVLCPLFSGGALFGRGTGVDAPTTDDSWYAATGLRVGVELPQVGRFRGRVQLDGYIPLRPTTLHIAKVDVWTSPAVFGTASLVVSLGSP